MEKKNHSVVIENFHWIVEKYWQANEGMMKRASTLIGFFGVELGLLAALDKKYLPKSVCFVALLSLATVLIGVGIGLLLWSVLDKDFDFPRFEQLKKIDSEESVISFLLSEDGPERSIYRKLSNENKHISDRFRWGTNTAVLGQAILIAALIYSWIYWVIIN
jgi:hypothetical protein